MLIYFDPRKQQPPRLGPQGFDGVIFCDGANDISNEAWAKIEGHAGVKAAIALGALRIPVQVPAGEYDAPSADQLEGVEIVSPDQEVLLVPKAAAPTLAEAQARLTELEGIYITDGWQAIRAIAVPLGVEKHPDGWDSSLLRIIQAEFGAELAIELEATQP